MKCIISELFLLKQGNKIRNFNRTCWPHNQDSGERISWTQNFVLIPQLQTVAFPSTVMMTAKYTQGPNGKQMFKISPKSLITRSESQQDAVVTYVFAAQRKLTKDAADGQSSSDKPPYQTLSPSSAFSVSLLRKTKLICQGWERVGQWGQLSWSHGGGGWALQPSPCDLFVKKNVSNYFITQLQSPISISYRSYQMPILLCLDAGFVSGGETSWMNQDTAVGPQLLKDSPGIWSWNLNIPHKQKFQSMAWSTEEDQIKGNVLTNPNHTEAVSKRQSLFP